MMSTNLQTISVLIPTWKRPEKLTICLEHMAIQSSMPNEIIVIVREEDIEAIDIIKKFKEKISNLKIVYSYEIGVIAAENAGLRIASSDLIAFIDDDGYAPSDWIQNILAFFKDFPEASALGGPDIIASEPWEYHDHEKSVVGILTWYGNVIGNHHRKITGGLRKVHVLKGVNMTFKRNSFNFLDEMLVGKDGNLGNGSSWELDICMQVLNAKGTIYFNPDLLVDHDSNHSTHVKLMVAKSNAHNFTYVMLKNLPLSRKIFFLFYAILIGNAQLPGLAKGVFDFIKQPCLESAKLSWAKLTGFTNGIQTYFKKHI